MLVDNWNVPVFHCRAAGRGAESSLCLDYSAPDMEEILTESESKLDSVRQKILQVAQELSGEDMHQFHRAVTTGGSGFFLVVTCSVNSVLHDV